MPLLTTVENETVRRETFSFEIYDVEYCGTARFKTWRLRDAREQSRPARIARSEASYC